MKITFVGQENFPVLGIYGHQRQGRVQALAESLSDSGHTVTAIFSAAKHKRALNRYKGIRLISRRLPLFYFLRHLWRKQPDA
ncbi:MAG TPA: hypothetical protein VFA15_07175, partial [Nitrososphaera sp.]|nr:hypothetical protein [Nitrososphaera sp.]